MDLGMRQYEENCLLTEIKVHEQEKYLGIEAIVRKYANA
jgi:hypothetical protein